MKFTVSAILGLAAMATFSVSAADEANDRFVTACVSDGDNQTVCECTANAMQTTFDQAQFDQIVVLTEAKDHDAGAALFQSIFAAQPNLSAVFSAAMAACQ